MPFPKKGVDFFGMKKLFPLLLGVALACSACAPKPVTLTYDLSFTEGTTPSRQMVLTRAVESVVKRKLKTLDADSVLVRTTLSASGVGLLTLQALSDQKEMIQGLLNEKFTFEIKGEKKPLQKGETPSPQNWEATGLQGDMLMWASDEGMANGKSAVVLEFTDEGKKILATVFQRYQGKSIGIFVRDILVSKLTVDGKVDPDRIAITGVPSAQVAKIFVDDVNVGLHVSFLPR